VGGDQPWPRAQSAYQAQYDVDNDQVVCQDDVTYELTTYFHTSYGDANLDRYTDFPDFQALLDNWQNSGADIGWAQADFNGDARVDFLDFQIQLDHWNPEGWNFSPSQTLASANTPSAAVSTSVGIQVASNAVAAPAADLPAATAPAVLTASASVPAPLDDSINLLSHEIQPSRTPSFDSDRSATRQLRRWTVSAPSDVADTVDLLTHLHSRPVVA
jgi:hypothetical protein